MSNAGRSRSASEATAFIRGGMLVLEPPHRWRIFDRAIWRRCERVVNLSTDEIDVHARRSQHAGPASIIILPVARNADPYPPDGDCA